MAAVTQNAAKANGNGNGGKVTNPYREGGSYHLVVDCLRKLGLGRMHSAEALIKCYANLSDAEALKLFKAKETRSDNGKDWQARIIQNAIVVNRPDYGAPLRAVGFEVRKARTDKGYEFGLFAIKPQPMPELKRTPKAAKASKPAPKAKAKAAK